VLTGHPETAEDADAASLAQLHTGGMAVAGAIQKNVVVKGRAEPAAEQTLRVPTAPCLRAAQTSPHGAHPRAGRAGLDACQAGRLWSQVLVAISCRSTDGRRRYWRPPRRRARAAAERVPCRRGAVDQVHQGIVDRGRCRGVSWLRCRLEKWLRRPAERLEVEPVPAGRLARAGGALSNARTGTTAHRPRRSKRNRKGEGAVLTCGLLARDLSASGWLPGTCRRR